MTLQFADSGGGFKVWKEKGGARILNSSGFIANGWQKKLTRSGTAFSGSDMTDGDDIKLIAGRVCPKYVFLSHSNMTATARCLYYDSGSPPQTFDRDFAVAGAVEAEDWLRSNNSLNTGRGVGSSYYEGNIKTCADKGMRLPVLYETSADIEGIFAAPDLPTGDPGINILVTPWSPGFNGLDLGPSYRLTASANPRACPTACYSIWAASGVSAISYNSNSTYSVTCVLPSH